MNFALRFSLLLCLSLPALADTKVEVEPGKEFTYKESAGKPRKLEVYYPEGWAASQKRVGIIFFHGGGWTGGNLTQFRYASKYLASRGIVAATAEYQLASKAPPAQPGESRKRVCMTDAKSAIRWMKQHAGELGIDPAKLLTGGGSAGGHLAVLATTTPGLDDPNDPKGIDTSVVGYLLFDPAFDPIDSSDAQIDGLQQIKAGMAPSIAFFGTEDPWFKEKNGHAALRKMWEVGNKNAELWMAPGQTHSFFNKAPWQDTTLAEADRFLVEHSFLTGKSPLEVKAKLEKAKD